MTAQVAQAFDRWQVEGAQGEATLKMGDGTALHLRVACPPGVARTVLLLLHGAGMHSGYYQTVGCLLASRGHLVLMPDQRGHGKSEGARGDIAHHGVYCEDIAWMLLRVKTLGLPVVLAAHSGAAAMSARVLAEVAAPQVAGFAMLTPTFADDGTLVRRNSGGRDYGTYFRYMLRPAPEAEVKGRAPGSRMVFRLGAFLFHRMTGLCGTAPVLTYQSSGKNEAPYTYTARGVRGSMVGRVDLLLARLRCPVFLATGGQDGFVNSDAVRTLLPWLIAPQASLQALHEAGGDHFTTLLLSAQALLKWLDTLVLESAQRQESI
ncbi:MULTISPECIES: alpha/beta hydrolase [unclassified Pseudomonas]|uniref:alpha/beta hydrolase n=1 Tax=unclassified Pseudomonas TaxID=196821 RepID=UPI000BA36A24|nr:MULTISPECIES: alpha/beta hydrolase [unclassified Pseudomonas]